ncbi:ferritin family protein [candidate division CSSED10-310 bacterium]|uniref:Ferritin family protein n=1 Tax=candidate division CSSED10-310 bacterium TaxID=2855610 RepID=A0ABV6Z725_UNCC1
MMNLEDYSLENCLLAALMSEMESEKVYLTVAERVKNVFLKDRLQFLADEERKHQKVFENWYQREFDREDIHLPDKIPVPLPGITIENEKVLISEVLEKAIVAEEAAEDFYRSFSAMFKADDERRRSLLYIAAMEKTHAQLLEIELKNVLEIESFHIEWPMMHMGP